MEDKNTRNKEMKDMILNSLHQQFAENQNHHQQLMIQIFSISAAIYLGYAYVYSAGGQLVYKNGVQNQELLTIVAIFSGIVFMLCASIIINSAHSFRRDQLVNRNIRKYYGLIGSDINIFPKNYDPLVSRATKKLSLELEINALCFSDKEIVGGWKRLVHEFSWMPNLYISLLKFVIMSEVTLFVSFIFNPYHGSCFWARFTEIKMWLFISVWLTLNAWAVNLFNNQKASIFKIYDEFEQESSGK